MSTIILPDDPSWACRECGCTDLNPCVNLDGETCFWVEEGLCSACAEEGHAGELELGLGREWREA